MTNTIFYILIFLLIFEISVSKFLDYLNKTRWSENLPEEAKSIYTKKEYAKSMKYEKTKHNFSNISDIFFFVIIFVMVVFGYFGKLYDFINSFGYNEIVTNLIFFGLIGLAQILLSLPFSYYSTFIIEEKFGFNKTTKKTFFLDVFKNLILGAIIGGILLSALIYIYEITGGYFWIGAWVLLTLFSVFLLMFYSTLIVPIFNKQIPLEIGTLRVKIEEFAEKMGFKLDNIYVINGSKRSSKANAYFSGFGPKKRIVLFDTLINDLTDEELVGVLAHEIGHYKRKHTLQMFVFSTIQTGIILFILGLTLKEPVFSEALGGKELSFGLSIIAFSILFTPISMIFGVLGNMLSRKNEYEADMYSALNYDPKELKHALIKLSKNNLSNLRPHPIYEFFYYSHPVVLKRIAILKKMQKKDKKGFIERFKEIVGKK